jgi:hypothetical protein
MWMVEVQAERRVTAAMQAERKKEFITFCRG